MRPFTEIGAAVVGTGFIGAVHVEALRRLGVQVHGVVGSSQERAATRSRELGLPPAYASFQAMLDDANVDVVHVTSRESADLLRAAERSGLVHATNFNIRFYATNQHLSGLIRKDTLGDVRLVSGHYLQDWLLLDTDWNWRLEPELGGDLRAVSD